MLRILIASWLGILCGGTVVAAAESAPIVTSCAIVDDWVGRVIGPEIRHQTLVPAGSELHGFQLGPQEAQALSKASLIVGFSPVSEPWLADWIQANGKEGRTLWLQTAEKDGAEPDTHAWTDPSQVGGFIRKIAAEARRTFKDVNSEVIVVQYLKEVEALDVALRKSFAEVPASRRKLVTQHPNLGLLARRYGLEVVGTILESPTAEAADPSARHYSALLALIRREQVRVLVTDEGQNDAIARRLCQDAGLPPPVALNFETLAPLGQPGDNWLGMMRLQAGKLREALLRP